MIDRITIYIKDVEIEHVESRLGLIPSGEAADHSLSYSTKIRNLKVSYKGRTLWIDGSLHKYAKGNNYSLFTYKEAKLVLEELSDYIGIPLDFFIVSKIELGLNFQVDEEVEKYLNIFHSYKSHPFVYMSPISGTSKLKGCRCSLAEYTIKVYDKHYEAIKNDRLPRARWIEVPNNLLRFEIQLRRKQLINYGLTNVTGKNLLSPLHYTRFKKLIYRIFNDIIFDDITIDYSEMLEEDVKRYIFAKSERYDLYLQYLRKIKGEREYRKERRKTNDLFKRIKSLAEGKFESELKYNFKLAMLKI